MFYYKNVLMERLVSFRSIYPPARKSQSKRVVREV
jgi:hypothetical protein